MLKFKYTNLPDGKVHITVVQQSGVLYEFAPWTDDRSQFEFITPTYIVRLRSASYTDSYEYINREYSETAMPDALQFVVLNVSGDSSPHADYKIITSSQAAKYIQEAVKEFNLQYVIWKLNTL
jgi:TPP-dependent indolepyruvate ferredoxin oxidoreductase alpha subunit